MRRMNSRRARRVIDQLGMKVEGIDNVKQVVIRTLEKEIIIDDPEVSVTTVQGQKIFQVLGGKVKESELKVERVLVIPEEDIHLVAQQAKVSLEVAEKALEGTQGDLALAILNLSQRR